MPKKSNIDAFIQKTENTAISSRHELAELQLRKLNELLKREHIRAGYYSHLPERIDSISELRRLPFTSQEDFAGNVSDMLLISQARVERIVSGATSGTTGPSKRIFFTERDLAHTISFFEAGISEMDIAGEKVMVAFPFTGEGGLGETIASAVRNLGAEPLCDVFGRPLGELCRLVDQERPSAYIGMPVPLIGLIRYYDHIHGRGVCPLFKCLISGDTTSPGLMEVIEKLTGGRTFPHYGSREMCFGGAITCSAHEGMHLRENHIIGEIVDPSGRILQDGEWGELVITTLDMEALPLIRYRTGDRARFMAEPCPCGSITRRLQVAGREENLIMAAMDEKLFALEELVDYSIHRQGEGFLAELVILGGSSGAKSEGCFSDTRPGGIKAGEGSISEGGLVKDREIKGEIKGEIEGEIEGEIKGEILLKAEKIIKGLLGDIELKLSVREAVYEQSSLYKAKRYFAG